MTERVLILDFGAQYTQLIARRVREAGVYCEILPYTVDDARISNFGAKAIILSGGPASTTAASSIPRNGCSSAGLRSMGGTVIERRRRTPRVPIRLPAALCPS